jgi:GGDEF domain-containing protein
MPPELDALSKSSPAVSKFVGGLLNRLYQAQKAAEFYRSLAETDELTGIPNRRYFNRVLEAAFRDAAKGNCNMSLLLADLDNFKSINDNYGHDAGDAVLRCVSNFMDESLRGYDILFRSRSSNETISEHEKRARPSRYGGEEFGIILPETGLEAAEAVANRLVSGARGLRFKEYPGRITLSIGVAAFPDPDITSPQRLVTNADLALYFAKNTGKDRACTYLQVK